MHHTVFLQKKKNRNIDKYCHYFNSDKLFLILKLLSGKRNLLVLK